MIEIEFSHIEKTKLIKTLERLSDITTLPNTVSSHLRHWNKYIRPAVIETKSKYDAMITEYGLRGEDGKVMTLNNQYIIKPDAQETYEKKMAELLSTKIKVLYSKLDHTDLQGVALSANDKDALDPFVHNIDSMV